MQRQSSRVIRIPGGPSSSEDQTLPLLPTGYQGYDTDERGELVSKSAPYEPKLTFEEEKRQQQARHQDYKAAVSHKDKLRCPACRAEIEGRVDFKLHLKDLHHWSTVRIRQCLGLDCPRRKQFPCPLSACSKKFTALCHLNEHARLKHGIPSRALRNIQKSKSKRSVEVADAPRMPVVSPETAIILKKNGISPEAVQKPISTEVLEILKKGAPSSIVEPEIIAPRIGRTVKRRSVVIEPSESDYEHLFNSTDLCRLIHEVSERKCFLLHHIMQKSMSEIAVEVFGSANKKPRVQKILKRVGDRLRGYLEARPRNSNRRESPAFARLWQLVHGQAKDDVFEVEVAKYDRKIEEAASSPVRIDYHPPNQDDEGS